MTHQGNAQVEAAAAVAARAVIWLRLIATTDLHAHLFPFNYYTDRRDDSLGLARAASLIETLRQGADNCLLLDNGDTLQGSPLGDAAKAEILPKGRPHPMIAAMNALSYDAATLGNHDFDYGLGFLTRSISDATYPVTLANARRRDGSAFLPGHVVLNRSFRDVGGGRHPLRIGVIGLAPPQIAQWNKTALGGQLVLEDMVTAVKREVTALLSQKVDTIIVLAHSGLGTAKPDPGAEHAAVAISHISGVDAVVAGHSHGSHMGAVNGGAPIVQPGYWGSHVGVIDLPLQLDPLPHKDAAPLAVPMAAPVKPRVALHAVSAVGPEARTALRQSLRKVPFLRRQLAEDHRLTRRFTGQPIGETPHPLETYFSLIAPCPALDLLADAKRSMATTLLAERSDLAGLPLAIAVAPFKSGGRGGPDNYTDIPAGRLQLRHVADLYVYANSLAIVRATGAQVRNWLERTAAAFHQIDDSAPPDRPQALIDHGFAGYNFDVFDGLHYTFDLRFPARTNAEGDDLRDGPGRVRDLTFADGTAICDDADILVATNSYRAAGGGHFTAAAEAETIVASSEAVRDIIARHMASRPRLTTLGVRQHWRFAPMGNRPVFVETGPGALGHPKRLATLGLQDAGPAEGGFHRFLWHI